MTTRKRKAAKAGGVSAITVAAIIGLAELINGLTSAHTVAHKVTDTILCATVDPSKCGTVLDEERLAP